MNRQNLFREIRPEKEEYEGFLKELVEIPSVSSEVDRRESVRNCAIRASQLIREFGGSSEIIEVDGSHPLVCGKFSSDSQTPIVTVYNHLDVIPASAETEPWSTDPFVFTKKGDRYFGRGATDDKGPALAALFGARLAQRSGVRANIQFIWECEEEIGSPNFEALLRKSKLRSDSVVISDTMWLSRNRPTITAGLRGYIGLILSLETGLVDQHSGDVGGVARNPLGELMQLVAQMFDARTGKILIPHFYDDVISPTRAEIRDFSACGFTVARFRKIFGYKSLRVNRSLDLMKRIWALPAFEIHGVVGGYTGPGLKSIVPPRGEVKASFRLAPGQDPKRLMRLVRDFIHQKNTDVRVNYHGASPAFLTQRSSPYADAAKNAIRFATGKDPVFVREGGSIPGTLIMQQVFKCPVMFLGFSLPDHGYHAPNENFDWQQASTGIIAFVRYFDEVSRMKNHERIS